jgi:hypothetical protein
LLTINERREAVRRYYPSSDKEHGFNRAYLFIGNNAIENIYLSEHPQQTVKEDSVVSLGDAGLQLLADELEKSDLRKYTCINLSGYSQVERNIVNGILNLQKEQYKELLSSYRELFEAIKLIEMKSWQKDEWEQMKIINNIAKSPLERATNILNNLK